MIIRSRSKPAADAVRSSVPSSWTSLLGGMVSGRTQITADSAMRHDAVWACVRLIAGTMATFPIEVYSVRGGRRVEVSSSLMDAPSAVVDRVDWIYQIMESLLLRGNAYGRIRSLDKQMFPTQIDMISADTVTWRPDGSLWVDGKRAALFPEGDVWHLPAYVPAGSRVGLSPIAYHAETIGLGLAAKKFGQSWFEDGAHPTHILAPERDPGPEQAQQMIDKFKALTRGSRQPIVLPQSVQLHRLQVDAEESQFLDTQKYSTEQVARIFGAPAEMIGGSSSGSAITYASLEQRKDAFVTFGLLWWVSKLDSAFSSLHPRGQKVRIRTAGLMKADLKGRYESYKVAAEIGKITGEPLLLTSEMRAFEDLPELTASQIAAAKPEPIPEPEPAPESDRSTNVTVSVAPAEVRIDQPITLAPAAVHVDVAPAEVRVDAPVTVMPAAAPTVNVAPAEVRVAPAEVRVEAPVTVMMPEPKRMKKNVVHDAEGRIVSISEVPE